MAVIRSDMNSIPSDIGLCTCNGEQRRESIQGTPDCQLRQSAPSFVGGIQDVVSSPKRSLGLQGVGLYEGTIEDERSVAGNRGDCATDRSLLGNGLILPKVQVVRISLELAGTELLTDSH